MWVLRGVCFVIMKSKKIETATHLFLVSGVTSMARRGVSLLSAAGF